MPTPIGHALGGLATAWFSQGLAPGRVWRDLRRASMPLLVACVVAAVAADFDILLHTHRSYTHSVGAVTVVGVVAWGIAQLWGGARLKSRPTSFGVTVAVAYGTHIVLDWLGKDTAPPFGLPALWPFTSRYYISGADLFMEIS